MSWTDEQDEQWFKTYWQKQVSNLERFLPKLAYGPNNWTYIGPFYQCQLNDRLDDQLVYRSSEITVKC